ncbi:cobalamin-independent methionine synthase II family protein [Corynebacterium phoceense]|uniref:cobalamin-independent methionine synthase II family protein n=1 Tax=Corynebacterium phoceense TaxID=1686286 RepID=UPI001E03C3A2|nr:cobalamin-independent methionine synthase II family protein [Corynebacterium phoceense]MCQ9336407.1 cobalamin-independent methionine synthase II family protein [Corynebacterium phoceense]HJG43542.1 cobalamin-independent methionine synthase II family protein [Corynebacterium phoceense]
MTQKIRTTHVGSLPRTAALHGANQRRLAGDISNEEFDQILQQADNEVVQRQVDLGIDIVNEGEYGHLAHDTIDYGAWWTYSFSRLGGLRPTREDEPDAFGKIVRHKPGSIELTTFPDRRDRAVFAEAYEDPKSGIEGGGKKFLLPTIDGPLSYVGQEALAADVKHLGAAIASTGKDVEGFIAAVSPGSAARIRNLYYPSYDELLAATAEVMSHEYRAIADAGYTVQIDAPDLAEAFDQVNPEPSYEDFRGYVRKNIDAINAAIKGIDKSKVRLHICWGSWHGPHSTDIPFEEIVDEILRAEVGGFTFEAANVRHGAEWRVWQNRKLPEGTVIIPGVVSHSTNLIEDPRLVADRIHTFAELVGPENVIASTDCGLGGRIHEQIAWAKLESLVKGAEIASQEIFG